MFITSCETQAGTGFKSCWGQIWVAVPLCIWPCLISNSGYDTASHSLGMLRMSKEIGWKLWFNSGCLMSTGGCSLLRGDSIIKTALLCCCCMSQIHFYLIHWWEVNLKKCHTWLEFQHTCMFKTDDMAVFNYPYTHCSYFSRYRSTVEAK